MREDCALHRAERVQLGVFFGVAKLLLEVGVSLGFAADGGDRAVDVAGCFAEAAATGDEGEDFAAFGVVEDARAAGAVEFGTGWAGSGLKVVCWGGDWIGVHGGLVRVLGGASG